MTLKEVKIKNYKKYNFNAVCKFFNKKSVQIVESDSHISG